MIVEITYPYQNFITCRPTYRSDRAPKEEVEKHRKILEMDMLLYLLSTFEYFESHRDRLCTQLELWRDHPTFPRFGQETYFHHEVNKLRDQFEADSLSEEAYEKGVTSLWINAVTPSYPGRSILEEFFHEHFSSGPHDDLRLQLIEQLLKEPELYQKAISSAQPAKPGS